MLTEDGKKYLQDSFLKAAFGCKPARVWGYLKDSSKHVMLGTITSATKDTKPVLLCTFKIQRELQYPCMFYLVSSAGALLSANEIGPSSFGPGDTLTVTWECNVF